MAAGFTETELKFQVPRGQRGALLQAVRTASASSTRLQALYADTAGQHLAAAGMALRLRKEGRVWVQTLKGRGDGLAQRFEHEVALAGVKGLPALDASLHQATPLGPALQRALQAGGPLLPVYRTDILRLHRRLRSGGAVVELALDRGHLIAGSTQAPVRAQVHEIEFELISGPPAALLALAARWVPRFGLWWDVRTKSERGFQLARCAAVAATSSPVPAERAAGGLPGLLLQVLRCAAELASPGTQAPEHALAHWRALGRALPQLCQALPQGCADLAYQLQVMHAGMESPATAAAIARSPGFNLAMLQVLGLKLHAAAGWD